MGTDRLTHSCKSRRSDYLMPSGWYIVKEKVSFISHASSCCLNMFPSMHTIILLISQMFTMVSGIFLLSLCFVRCSGGSSSVWCLTHVCLLLWLNHWAVKVFSRPQRSGFQNGSHRLTKRGNVWQAAVTDVFVASALVYSDFCLTGYRWHVCSCQQCERDGIQAFRYGDSLHL